MAARRAGLAAPHPGVMRQVTARRAQGACALEDVGSPVRTGVADPRGMFRVFSPTVGAGGPCLVGRDEAMGVLMRRWEPSQEGRGQVGRGRITSEITHEAAEVSFGVLHFGDHNPHGGVREFQGEAPYQALVQELGEVFARVDFPEVIRLLDRHFGEPTYSLRSLFRDERREIVNRILESTQVETEAVYRRIYQDHSPLMRFVTDLRVPLPKAFHAAAGFILDLDLRSAFQEETPPLDRVRALLEEVRMWRVDLDTAGLGYVLQRTIERVAERFRRQAGEKSLVQQLEAVVGLARSLPFSVDLWRAQNAYYEVLQTVYPAFRAKADQGDEAAQMWIGHFTALGEKLSVRVGSEDMGEKR